jgi:hypothetical protein
MKKLYSVVLTALAFSCHGETMDADSFKEKFKLLDNEIRIVKLKDFMKSSITSDDDQKFMTKFISEMKQTKKEMDDKGYVYKPSPYINFLLNEIKDEKTRSFIQSKSSELSDNLSQIKISYDYKPLNPSFYEKHWGFSPMGTYNDCYDNECRPGWTGAVEYFEKEGLTCSYSEHNTKEAHGGNELVEELITYNVNNKPTIELVTKDTTGHLYTVHWFKKDYDRTIDCASVNYSKEIFNLVIGFAKKIDTYQN